MLETDNIKKIKQDFRDYYMNGKIAGTWLLSGMKGVGKASVALEIAKMLLVKNSADEVQLEKRVHPDLLYIEKPLTEKEKKDKAKLLKDGKSLDDEQEAARKRSSQITVDEVRNIDTFIRMSSSSGWKVIIIDAADDMNNNAANAVLKVIEEPPANTVILLVAHNPRKLLPTIISRCRQVYFTPLKQPQIQDYLVKNYGLLEKDAAVLAEFSVGSIGKAISLYQNNGVDVFRQMCSILRNFPKIDVLAAYTFAEKMEKDEDAFEIAKELFSDFLAIIIKYKSQNGGGEPDVCFSPSSLLQNFNVSAMNTMDLSKLLDLWFKTEQNYKNTLSLFLDKKQFLVNSFLEFGLCG